MANTTILKEFLPIVYCTYVWQKIPYPLSTVHMYGKSTIFTEFFPLYSILYVCMANTTVRKAFLSFMYGKYYPTKSIFVHFILYVLMYGKYYCTKSIHCILYLCMANTTQLKAFCPLYSVHTYV